MFTEEYKKKFQNLLDREDSQLKNITSVGKYPKLQSTNSARYSLDVNKTFSDKNDSSKVATPKIVKRHSEKIVSGLTNMSYSQKNLHRGSFNLATLPNKMRTQDSDSPRNKFSIVQIRQELKGSIPPIANNGYPGLQRAESTDNAKKRYTTIENPSNKSNFFKTMERGKNSFREPTKSK